MKNLNLTKTYIFVVTVFIIASAIFGCSENSLTSFENNPASNPPVSDSVYITVDKNNGGYLFKVTNHMVSHIVNDFHVQFDTSVAIIGQGIFMQGWVFDNNTTDLEHGKIGVKAGQNGQPINSSQTCDVIWVRLKFRGDQKIGTFNWQATENGVTVSSGTGRLP